MIDGENDSVVFTGASPALTVISGDVLVTGGVTFTNATDAPTILVLGGSLTLRDAIVEETTSADRPAIEVVGGTVDLGTAAEPGGDTHTFLWQVSASNGQVIADSSAPNLSFVPVDNGTYSVSYTVTDDDGGVGSDTVAITVHNVAPTPSIDSISATQVEGTQIDVTGSATDPAGANDTLTYGWTVARIADDGTVSTSYATGEGANWNFTPDDNGDCEIALTVADEDGGSTAVSQTISVANVAPTADDVGVDLVENPSAGANVATVTATDPGNDQITYTIVGGSGATAFAIDAASGDITVADPSLVDYDTSPTLTLQVLAADEDGGSDTAKVTVNLLNQASISGVVFVDVNEDGLYQANEPGIDDVVIELHDSSGAPLLDPHGAAITALTSDGGLYLFEDLEPAEYQLHELQPTGVADGVETLGSLAGAIVADDTMQLTLARTDAYDYAFAEIGGQVTSGESAGIGFWQNKHGQQLIAASGTGLSSWLTANFGNVFGNALAGASNAQVADFYRNQLFLQKSKKSSGPAKVDAQFMATAMGVYFTNRNLAGDVGADYGFTVSHTGLGARVVNVGSAGAAFSADDGTNLTVIQLLRATNGLTDMPENLIGFAAIYDTNGDGVIDADEAHLRALANDLYAWINGQ